MAGTHRINTNEIIRLVTDTWALVPTIVGMPGPFAKIVIVNNDGDGNPDDGGNKRPWMRMRIQHTASIATSINQRRWKNSGTLMLNIFVARGATDIPTKTGLIGDALKLAIRKHRGNVNFTGVTLRERPINNNFNQVDVSAAFWWEEITGA